MADRNDSGPLVWPLAGPPSGSLAGGTTSVSAWLRVIRPDDLLSLTFGLVNLAVQDGQLVRVDPGSPAAVIVGLPPQHVDETSLPSDAPAFPAQVAAAIAGGSQLAFTVPDGVTSLPLNLPTLLGWAAFVPVPPSSPAGTAARPSASGSILELPYRMLLAVDGARWQHSASAVVDPDTGTAELWRTTAVAPSLHVAWSQDLEAANPGASLPDFPDPLDVMRAQIAGRAPALEADSLTLSALGATTSLHAMLPDSPVAGVTDWHHVTSVGRDSYVRTVQRGYLAPFGHPAAVVTVTERVPVTATPLSPTTGWGPPEPVEELVSTSRIVLLSPQVDYTAPAAAAAYSAQSPVMTVPLRTVRLPDPAAPLVVDPSLGTAGGVVRTSSQAAFSFRAVAEDLSGSSVELSLPMAFVPAAMLDTADTIYQGLATELGAAAAASLRGQSVAFVGVPGAAAAAVDSYDGTVLPVDSMSFKLFNPSDPSLPFLPQLQEAAVWVPSASALAGAQTVPWTIVYHPDYLVKGIDPAVNPGTVFASVTSRAVLQMAASAAGGLAAPQVPIDGLSRALGPVAGAAGLVNGQFDPTSLLSQFDQAVFLGGIKLSDILAPVEAAGFSPASVPGFIRSQLPKAIQVTFTWNPPLRSAPVTPPPAAGTSGTAGGSGPASLGGLTIDTGRSALSLSVTATAPLDPSLPPTSEMHGQLTNVSLTFMQDVKLDVDLLTFTAKSGHKVDLTLGHLSFTFTGNLAFLDELVQALPADAFGAGPYVDADAHGVTAGYSLAIPSIAIGIISIENVAFEAALSLPLALPPQPLDLRVCFSTREHPFLVTVSFIGGGGYFCADVGSDGVHLIEGSLDLAADLSVDLAIVSAEVHVLAGFYFGVSQSAGTTFSAFLRIGGSVNLLGLISVSVELYLALAYSSDQSEISGTASLTLAIHVLFMSKSVTLSVEKHFRVPRFGAAAHAVAAHPASARPADGIAPAAPGPVSFGDVISPDAWNLYLSAFA